MAIILFCKVCSYKEKKTSKSDFSIGCGAQLAYETASRIIV
jgi:hypothetical protein